MESVSCVYITMLTVKSEEKTNNILRDSRHFIPCFSQIGRNQAPIVNGIF